MLIGDSPAWFAVKLNARRQVSGIMRGFDQFMNIVLDKATDDKDGAELGMVVCPCPWCTEHTALCMLVPYSLMHGPPQCIPVHPQSFDP